MVNWRLLSADLCREHTFRGHARLSIGRIHNLESRTDLPILNLTPTPLTVGGPYLRPKQVREWFWANRHLRAMHRPWSLLVTQYNPEHNLSTLHIGTITLPEVVSRYTCMVQNRSPLTPLVL